MNDLFTGSKYVIAGLKLIIKPGIRLYVLVPFLVNSILFAGIIIYGVNQLSDFIDWLSSLWAWTEWLGWLLWPFFLIIILTVIFFCFSIVANLIAAPFNGFLAEAVEFALTGEKAENSGKLADLPAALIVAMQSEFRKFRYFILWLVPLLILFVIPVIQAIAPLTWFLFGAWMLALEYLEFPLSNNGLLFPQIRKILGSQRQLTFGFGVGVMIFTMLPIANFIAMPVAVAGATKLWTDRIKN